MAGTTQAQLKAVDELVAHLPDSAKKFWLDGYSHGIAWAFEKFVGVPIDEYIAKRVSSEE